MATPKPGEIRCPTCHRSTPPAAFCTQCGSAIPSDARIRPRGLDREELQERIRARRTGAEPWRRGAAIDDGLGYERYQPEPEDEVARRASAVEAPRRDLLREPPPLPVRTPDYRPSGDAPTDGGRGFGAEEWAGDRDDWARRTGAAVAPTMAPPPPAAQPHLAPVPEYPRGEEPIDYGQYDAGYAEEYEEWDEWEGEPERRSAGAGAIAILGFLALGVLALLGGAVLAGIFGDDPQTGGIPATPSPSAAVSDAPPSAEPSPEPTTQPSEAPGASDGPTASGDVVVFPDGFVAEVQTCLPGSADVDGCDNNGADNSGSVVIWVGFRNGSAEDVISAEVRRQGASSADGRGTMDLVRLGCGESCNGWTYFPFDGLDTGAYDVRVTRNGQPAGETSFVVS